MNMFDLIPKSIQLTFCMSSDSADNMCCAASSSNNNIYIDNLDQDKDLSNNTVDFTVPRKLQRGDLVVVKESNNNDILGKSGRVYSISGGNILVKLDSKVKDREISVAYTFAYTFEPDQIEFIRPLYEGFVYVLSLDSLYRKWVKKYFEIRDDEFNFRDEELSPDIKFSIEISSSSIEDIENEFELPGHSSLPSKLSYNLVRSLRYKEELKYLCFLNALDAIKVSQLMSRIIFKDKDD